MIEWPTSRELSEEEKRLVRVGFYRKYDKAMDSKLLDSLSEREIAYYKSYEEPFRKKFKEFMVNALAFVFGIAFLTSPVRLPLGWNMLFPSASSTTQSTTDTRKADCNPNYSPCISNSSYDLDCMDIGKTVRVIGYDEYGLDRDHDGFGCDSY